MVNTLLKYKALWYKKCRSILHSTAINRLDISSNVSEESINTVGEDKDVAESSNISARKSTRGTLPFCNTFNNICIFCQKEGKNILRQVMTTSVHEKVVSCANILTDNNMLAKLAFNGDMIAMEAKYHPSCLLLYYRKAAKLKINNETNTTQIIDNESLALAELVNYLEESRNNILPSVFKLCDINKMYIDHLKTYNIYGLVNRTRLKDRLLNQCPDLIAVNHGREVLLTFKENVGEILHHSKNSSDQMAISLVNVVKLLRNEILENNYSFNGSFSSNAQEKSVSTTLLTFIRMILEVPGHLDLKYNQAAISIAQLISFNVVKNPRRNSLINNTAYQRHNLKYEKPLPIYLGLTIHSLTRKKKIINKFFRLGLSISYDLVLEISNKLTNRLCKQYKNDNLVCPFNLRENLFTVAAIDNIDHNLSSNTANQSFHGTAISLMQFSSSDNIGIKRTFDTSFIDSSSDIIDIHLPSEYTEIIPFTMPQRDLIIPKYNFSLINSHDILSKEFEWLSKVEQSLDSDNISNISWTNYHSSLNPSINHATPLHAILPLFKHSSNSAAMIKHSFNIVSQATFKLNPNQTPVLTYDQPLYALAKQLQWHCKDDYGEDKFVIMMGGLHIEMAILRMIGHWLDGSGWVECLVQSEITTLGIAESFIKGSHIKRTRYAHTVTAAALYICLKKAYIDYNYNNKDAIKLSFQEWINKREELVQFKFWYTVLELELLLLTFMRSIRSSNFSLYIETLQNIIPWFFLLDQINYARWTTIHLRDMLVLKNKHPLVAEQFLAGNK